MKVCVRRPRCAQRHHHGTGIRKPSHEETHAQQQLLLYSITQSARSRNDSGIVRPGALAALRLMTSSNLVGSRREFAWMRTPEKFCRSKTEDGQ